MHLEKKYNQKDFLKVGIIAGIIVIPLLVAYGAGGYFEENGTKFWAEWDCDQLIEFARTPEFSKITDEQLMQYDLDMAPCVEEP